MQIRHSIFKKQSPRLRSKWTLRFRWTEDGREKERSYQFNRKLDAVDARPRLEAELKQTQGRSVVGGKMTFKDLADHAKRTFYRPAEIVDGRKVAGVKAHRQTHILIDSLVSYFGARKLSSITRSDLDGYKSWRLKQGDLRGHQGKLKPSERKPVSLSTVNRGLAIFKHMMKFAHAEGWISRDITLGSKAIDPDAEKARTRTLTEAEETLLLASCEGVRTVSYTRKGKPVSAMVEVNNPYLKAAILLGLDAGLRRNEVLTLDWSDIDFERGFIRVQSRHTKTQRSRNVPLRERLKVELQALPSLRTVGRIFPFADFKRSWATALRIAGIEGLNFHDLRRTFITRLSMKGVPLAVAGKLAGHSTLATTQKHYISTDDLAILDDVRARMDATIEDSRANEFLN